MHFIDRGCMSYYTVLAILTLVFITLMLHQYITWTWWVALSPIWVMAAGCVLTPLFYIFVSLMHCSDCTVLLGDRSTPLSVGPHLYYCITHDVRYRLCLLVEHLVIFPRSLPRVRHPCSVEPFKVAMADLGSSLCARVCSRGAAFLHLYRLRRCNSLR